MAKLVDLEVEKRSFTGGSNAKRLRKSGFIPGVVYAEGKQAKSLSIARLHYQRNVIGRGLTQLYKFKSSDSNLDGLTALIKDVQREPIRDEVFHVDFLSISEGHRITVTVPLRLLGEPAAVKTGDSVLNQSLYELEVNCLPSEIPDELTLDISSLTEGDSLHASDIKLPSGVTLRTDPKQSLVSVVHKMAEEIVAPTAAAAAAPTVEGAVPAEGAGGTAAAPGAAAPAAGGAAKDAKSKDTKAPK